MLLSFRRHWRPFQHLFHQVNAATWTIQLVAEELIGWTRRKTKAAVHALAQNAVGFLPFRRVLYEISEISLHRIIRSRTSDRD
jgi:hypothetical protein